MAELTLGVLGRARKPDEKRLALHPGHLGRIPEPLRERLLLETDYARDFGVDDDELAAQVGGVVSREELLARSDVVVLPKPAAADVAAFRAGQVLWGWPHLVQDADLTQAAIDARATVIAWESMHRWDSRGGFEQHVFHANNELAGYCSVLHALQLVGRTGAFGRPLSAGVISFGSTGRGAVRALDALGVADITLYTQREAATVERPAATVSLATFVRDEARGAEVVLDDGGRTPMADALAAHDVVVNCFLQDTDRPLVFVDEPGQLRERALVVDVSVDAGMAFAWAAATSFAAPLVRVGGLSYYAVDHSPSLLWDSATWAISEALIGSLAAVMGGPEAQEADPTIARATEIRDGAVLNPAILRFQHRSQTFPYARE